LSDLII
jgi:hypothetical protein